jgi:Cu(I)/Ag(I) efflux system protein CusF
MKRCLPILFAAMVASAAFAQSNAPSDHNAHHGPTGAAATTNAMAEGEVRRVDRDAQKITLRHGPLPNLGMSEGMTMVFRVTDPTMLEDVKAGDKVRFSAERVGGQYTVTEIVPAK